MLWVWVVTTAFVAATFITVKLRGYKRMPHALRDAIAADAIFRTLLALNKDCPLERPIQRFGSGIPTPVLAGLHHQYVRI